VESVSARIGDRNGVSAVAAAARSLRRETTSIALRSAYAQQQLERCRLRAPQHERASAGRRGGAESDGEEGDEAMSWDMG